MNQFFMDVEERLLQDRKIYGHSFYAIENGVKVRLDPMKMVLIINEKTKEVSYSYNGQQLSAPVKQQ